MDGAGKDSELGGEGAGGSERAADGIEGSRVAGKESVLGADGADGTGGSDRALAGIPGSRDGAEAMGGLCGTAPTASSRGGGSAFSKALRSI